MRRCLQRAMINPKTDESNRLRGFEPETKTMFANKDWFGERCDPRDASGWIEHGIDGANLISRLLIEPLLRLIQEKNLKKKISKSNEKNLSSRRRKGSCIIGYFSFPNLILQRTHGNIHFWTIGDNRGHVLVNQREDRWLTPSIHWTP